MTKEKKTFILKMVAVLCFAVFIMVMAAAFVPKKFPVGTIVRVPKDSSLTKISESLYKKNVINSQLLFKAVVGVFYRHRIIAGDYAFNEPQNLWTVIRRLTRGDQGLQAIKVTIPEGATVEDIAWILLKKIPEFNAPYFMKIAENYEGYLFPDTYHFYQNTTADEAFEAMRDNFNKKFQSLLIDVAYSKRSPKDVIIMASLLEKEAREFEDKAKIAGILWKRLDEGMPLQVDATIVYLTDQAYTSINDTKIDSPYNTYKNKGLPPGAISNPGLESLRAAAQPVKTPYYYYLSDSKGEMHYAVDFGGHQINRERYLRK